MIDVVMPTCRPRLQVVIQYALDGLPHRFLSPDADLRNKRVLFALAADAEGMDAATLTLLRRLRGQESAMEGSLGAVISDGEGEFYTKQLAQDFVLAANAAGCGFPGKPLVEGTGSLYNQHILARQRGLT